MARPRTPTNILELKGAFKKNPQRARKAEPVPTGGIGPAPKRMTKRQQEAWDEVVTNCPAGVMGNSDRIALEVVVVRIAAYQDSTELPPVQEATFIFNALGRFGMTPSDRSKIIVPKGKEKNPFADLD